MTLPGCGWALAEVDGRPQGVLLRGTVIVGRTRHDERRAVNIGQYLVLINETKQEYVCPFCAGGTSKFWEWLAQNHSRLLTYLMRKSDETGGGDIADPKMEEWAGRWAGDAGVSLLGDYDSSGLYEMAYGEYTNITPMVAKSFNEFMGLDDLRVEVGYCSSCGERAKQRDKEGDGKAG